MNSIKPIFGLILIAALWSANVSAIDNFFTLEPIISTKGSKPPTDKHTAHAQDYFPARGTAVYPIAPGKVIEVVTGGVPIGDGTKYTGKDMLEHDPGRGLGNYVIVEHAAPDGKIYYSTYGHMESVAISKGTPVNVDTSIGAVGDTGMYLGSERKPHLHVQVDNVKPQINGNTGKLFPVFPYSNTDPRHGGQETKKLTEDVDEFIEKFSDKTGAFGYSREKFNNFVASQAMPSLSEPAAGARSASSENAELLAAIQRTATAVGSLVVAGSTPSNSIPPPTNVNNNISSSGASTALGNPDGIGIGFGGAGAYSTGGTTADYAATRGGYWRFAGGKLVSWDVTPLGSSGKGSVGGASNIIDGSHRLSDGSMAYWGRWLGATQITSNAGANVNGATVFYAYGNAAGALPANSRFTYQPAALGSPFGATGCCGSFQGGTITVDTGTRAVSLNSLKFGYAPSSAFGAATFLMNGTGTYSNTFKLGGHLTGTCTGGLCGGAGVASSGAYAGQFIGTTGTGIALSYGAVATGVSGTVIGGLGATVFKR